MEDRHRIGIDVHLDDWGALDPIASEIRQEVTCSPKRLPCKNFCDERVCRPFERITGLPEYRLPRAERAPLEEKAKEIVELTMPAEFLELSTGSAKKPRSLIEAGLV
jgi:L-histidine N-alpha-methyltransferase